MIKLFRNNQPLNLVLLLITALILRGSVFFRTGTDTFWLSAPLTNDLHEFAAKTFTDQHLLYSVTSFVLILVQAFYLNYILTKHNFFFRNSYLPALFFVLLNSLYPSLLGFSSQLTASFFIIIVLDKIFSLYDNDQAVLRILDAGMFCGIATLFSFDALVFFPFLLYSIIVMRPFSIRELLVAFTGLLIPMILLGVIYFLNGEPETVKNAFFIRQHASQINTIEMNYENVLPVVIALPLLVIAAFTYQGDIGRNNVKTRKIQSVVMGMLFFVVASAFFAKPGFAWSLPYFSLPCCIILSYYFLLEKRKTEIFKELAFAALAILIITLQFLK